MAELDLNLMRVFVSVFEARSLTTAAGKLYVTQSAVSQSLSRLRKVFGDPLFERNGREMEPTPVAMDAYSDIREGLERIDSALGRVREFDPIASSKRFRIALSELGEIGWLGELTSAVRKVAPNVVIESVQLDAEHVVDWLERGRVDVAVTPADTAGTFVRSPVKDQHYAAVVSSLHPCAGSPLTREALRQTPRAVVAADSGHRLLEEAERRAEVHVAPSVMVQRFASLPGVLMAEPTLLSTVPRPIAEGWAATGELAVLDLPYEVPPVRLHVCRRGTSQSLSALDWFYEQVVQCVVSTPARFATIQADLG